MSFSSPRKYYADDQAAKIEDVFNEARQMALNQRRIFRVEINKTKKRVILINEKDKTTASDDTVVRFAMFNNDIVINDKPNEVVTPPPTTYPVSYLSYVASNYPLSPNDEKITLRFKPDGQVVDAGSNNTGSGSVVTGAIIYIYTVNPQSSKPDVIRAITLSGVSGSMAIHRCVFNPAGNCGSWVQ